MSSTRHHLPLGPRRPVTSALAVTTCTLGGVGLVVNLFVLAVLVWFADLFPELAEQGEVLFPPHLETVALVSTVVDSLTKVGLLVVGILIWVRHPLALRATWIAFGASLIGSAISAVLEVREGALDTQGPEFVGLVFGFCCGSSLAALVYVGLIAFLMHPASRAEWSGRSAERAEDVF